MHCIAFNQFVASHVASNSLLAATGVAIVELGDWNSFNAAPEQTEEVSAPTLTLANAIILRTSMKCLPFL